VCSEEFTIGQAVNFVACPELRDSRSRRFDHASQIRSQYQGQWRAHRDLALTKESIPRTNAGSCHSNQDLPFVWRWRRHVVNPDYVGRTEFLNSCCFHFFFSSQSKFLRIHMEMMVVSYSLDLAQGAIQLVKANFCNSTRATQLVHTEEKLRTSCQKERSSGGGKYGKIQRGFHSQRHRHRDPE